MGGGSLIGDSQALFRIAPLRRGSPSHMGVPILCGGSQPDREIPTPRTDPSPTECPPRPPHRPTLPAASDSFWNCSTRCGSSSANSFMARSNSADACEANSPSNSSWKKRSCEANSDSWGGGRRGGQSCGEGSAAPPPPSPGCGVEAHLRCGAGGFLGGIGVSGNVGWWGGGGGAGPGLLEVIEGTWCVGGGHSEGAIPSHTEPPQPHCAP